MSEDTFNLIQKELKNFGKPKILEEEKKPREERRERKQREEKKGGRRKKDKEWDEQRIKRLEEWEKGGNKGQHELIEEKHNQEFVDYYKAMGIVPPAEFEVFYKSLKEPLDICFRVNSAEYSSLYELVASTGRRPNRR